jgi:putative transposase
VSPYFWDHGVALLKTTGKVLASMSCKGDCWDNAPMESVFARLKGELIDELHYRSRAEAWADVFGYLEGWYNQNAFTPAPDIARRSKW